MAAKAKSVIRREIPVIGERVCIRPIIDSDAIAVLKCLQDKELLFHLRYFSFFTEPPSFKRQADYFSRMENSPNDFLMAIESREHAQGEQGPAGLSRDFIGTVGMHDIDEVNSNCRLGIIIFNRYYWRKGYAKETLNLVLRLCFEKLGMNKVYLTARADNGKAIEIYAKLGFIKEGIMRHEYKVREGEYIDLLRMSILREEWQADRKFEAMQD